MRAIIEGPPEPGAPPGSLLIRLGWFAGIATAAAAVTIVLAYLLRVPFVLLR